MLNYNKKIALVNTFLYNWVQKQPIA